MWRRGPRGRGRWSCGRRPWCGVWRTGFGPGILCGSGHRNGDGQRGWSAGGSGAFPLTSRATVILTYQHVVERNDNGPDGWFFRTALVAPF